MHCDQDCTALFMVVAGLGESTGEGGGSGPPASCQPGPLTLGLADPTCLAHWKDSWPALNAILTASRSVLSRSAFIRGGKTVFDILCT